jgi:hypothetical protein
LRDAQRSSRAVTHLSGIATPITTQLHLTEPHLNDTQHHPIFTLPKAAIALLFLPFGSLLAQHLPTPTPHPAQPALAAAVTDSAPLSTSTGPGLPDAPSAASAAGRTPPFRPAPIAPLYHKYIEPGQTAQPLAASDKVLFGVHQLMSPYMLLTITAAAGYEQAVNGSPNFGTNIGAYGQRVGAAALRDASQDIFSDSIMAAVLHEDPRYYVIGKRRNPAVRAAYAVSRVFITQSDNGDTTPNYSLISGYAGAAALENAYYPASNHGFSETAKSFGGSLGGAAISNAVREFLPDILHAAHLE